MNRWNPLEDSHNRRVLLGVALGLCVLATGWAAPDDEAQPQSPLKDVPANTWTRVLEAKTGGREQPVFVYAGKIRRFVSAAGMQY